MNRINLHESTRLVALFVMATFACLNLRAQEDISKKEPFYVNEATIYMAPEEGSTGVTRVSEGIWARKFSDGYQFYNLQGQPFTDTRWIYTGHESPRMTRWGMILRKAGSSYDDPYFLIKPNGDTQPLPDGWSFRTIFVDSLAIASVKEGNRNRFRYITPDLKVAFPHLSPSPERFEDANDLTPPLSEGLRAFCTEADHYLRWGYIDAQGNIVIEPQFVSARSFHCGLALVTDVSNRQFFINKEGKKAFDLSWPSYEKVSDFDSGLCAAPGEKYDQTVYYDKSGNLVMTLKRGSPFHKGYAYCQVFDKATNKDYVHRVDHLFNDKGTVNVTTMEYDAPWYDELDVAHFKSRAVDGAASNGYYFYDYSIGAFSKEGVAPAVMVTNDGRTTLKGFIDRQGHFKLVYDKQTK